MSASQAPPILIVEDDRLFRDLAVETLRSEGFIALGIGSAAEALVKLTGQSDVALVVTDINMPGMNGLELIKVVRPTFPALKFLVISGRERVDAELLPQPAEFLQKPFSAQSFVAKVRSMLD